MPDTGAGATLTLGTTGTIGTIRSIQLPEFSIDTLDVSALATTAWMTLTKTDLANPGEISAEILFDAETGVVPALGVHELITVNFPKIVTSAAVGNLTATGFIKSFQMPELKTNELQIATITIALDGGYNSGTVPTWDDED
jgi:hypothetical protein